MNKEQLSIGLIVPHFPSYTETFFVSQVAGLCGAGHQVFVFCHTKLPDKTLMKHYGLDKYTNLHIINFNFHTITFEFFKNLFTSRNHASSLSYRSFRSKLYRLLCISQLNKYACDVYHFGYTGIAIPYLDFFEKIDGKKVVSCRGTAENVLGITEKGRQEKLQSLFQKVDSIICVSNALAQKVIQLGADKEKIFVNRPAINIHFFATNRNIKQVQENINIVSVGRMVFQKGYMLGLLAIAELRTKFKNFTWTIAGDGPGMEELILSIDILKLNKHVFLVGRKNLNEIKNLYETADIFFLPSVSEGIANVVLEAMAMELPVISSDCGGMHEVITHNADGILCKNYCFESFSESLLELSINAEKRNRIGKMARKRIEEAFTVQRFNTGYENEYLKLVNT